MRFLRTLRDVLIHRKFNGNFLLLQIGSVMTERVLFLTLSTFFKISNRNNMLTMNKLLTFGRFHEIKFKQAYDEWVGRVLTFSIYC